MKSEKNLGPGQKMTRKIRYLFVNFVIFMRLEQS